MKCEMWGMQNKWVDDKTDSCVFYPRQCDSMRMWAVIETICYAGVCIVTMLVHERMADAHTLHAACTQ